MKKKSYLKENKDYIKNRFIEVKDKKGLIVLSILFLGVLLFCNFASAVPPVTTVGQFAEGYVVIEAQQQNIKFGEHYTYHFFLYNTSNGVTIDNSTVVCEIFSSDVNGDIVLATNMSYSLSGGYWYYNISSYVFNYTGYYSYSVNCQDGGFGGALAGAFEVTNNGLPHSESRTQSMTNGVWVLFSIFIVMFLGYLFVSAKSPIKWTFFLIAMMFLMQTLYILFTSMSNEIVGSNIENYFSFLASASSILFWFAFGLLAIMWFLTTLQSLLLKKKNKDKEKYG